MQEANDEGDPDRFGCRTCTGAGLALAARRADMSSIVEQGEMESGGCCVSLEARL